MAVETEVNGRVQELRNYMNQVQAIEAGLLFHIHEAVATAQNNTVGQFPDYSQIAGNDTLKRSLQGIVESAYSLNNPMHPMNGAINQAGLNNFYNNALLQDLVFPHKDAVKAAIGEDGLVDRIRGMAGESQKKLQSRLATAAGSDIVARQDLDELKTYLKTRYDATTEAAAIIDAVNEKSRLANAYTLDVYRGLGADISAQKIADAIRGTQG